MTEPLDVIQLITGHWSGCFAVVEDVREWGVICQMIGPISGGGVAEYPLRLAHTDYVVIGKQWSAR